MRMYIRAQPFVYMHNTLRAHTVPPFSGLSDMPASRDVVPIQDKINGVEDDDCDYAILNGMQGFR